MFKTNICIEIVRSDVDGLSSLSSPSAEAILKSLKKTYEEVKVTSLNNIDDLLRLVDRNPDLVFLGMKFLPTIPSLGKHDPLKIWIAKYLDRSGICYTGSPYPASTFDHDKSLAKKQVQGAGLSTSPFFTANPKQYLNDNELPLGYPLFIKPVRMGGGQGVDERSIINNFAEYESKVLYIFEKYNSESLVEEYLSGREFSVAVLAGDEGLITMPIELVAPINKLGDRMLSQVVKASNEEIASSIIDLDLKTKINNLAADVFVALGARDYGRIDVRLDKDGVPQFLEANLIPSLISGYGSFPKACMINLGLGYDGMINTIVEIALHRQATVTDPLFDQEPVAA